MSSRHSLPTAKPDGYLAGVILAFLSTAGLFYVNIMAAIVDGLVSGLGFSDRAAGDIGSANIYGAALGALIIVFLVKRIPWRPTAIALLLLLIVIDLGSVFIIDAAILLPVRFLHGIVGGMLVGISFAVIARTGKADRTFGILLFVQFGLGGLGVMTLPRLVPVYGPGALFIALALFSIVTLLMVPFLAAYKPDRKGVQKTEGGVAWRPLIMTLFAIFLFQGANMGLLAYMIRLGVEYGLSREYVSTALGAATWVALLGPGLVIVMGVRFGRFVPLATVMLLTLVGTALFHWSGDPVIYMIANCGTGITWGMVIAYLLGMASQFDAAGRTAAAAGFISKIGLASGPLIAGRLLAGEGSWSLLINVAVVTFVVSIVVMLPPAWRLDRQSRTAGTPEAAAGATG